MRAVLMGSTLVVAGCSDPLPAEQGPEFESVSAGPSYTCGLRTDGTVSCWGRGDPMERGTPDDPDDQYVSVEVGRTWQACAIRTDGSLDCWTIPGTGTDVAPTPPAGSFEQVAFGDGWPVGRHSDGSVLAWGSSVPDGLEGSYAGEFVDVAAGVGSLCGIAADGTAQCWTQSPPKDILDVPMTSDFVEVEFNLAGHVSEEVACGIRATQEFECWGDEWTGEGDLAPPVAGGRSLGFGLSHACVLGLGGIISCWGDDTDGRATPPDGEFEQLSVGADHACALDRFGQLTCWGNNGAGELDPP